MKKMFALLLVLVLIGLCACSGAPQNGKTPQNKPGKGSENAENPNAPAASTMLRFAINPAFALYLDEAKNILAAEGETEDAKTLFAQLDLAGKPYAEGITAILDAAYTQGYLKDGSEIQVTVDIPQSADFSLAFIGLPIYAFQREKGITINTVINLSADPNTKATTVVIDGRKYSVSVEPLYGQESTIDNLVKVGTIIKYIGKRITEEDAPTSYSKKEVAQFIEGETGVTWVTYYRNDSVLRTVNAYTNGEFSDISYRPDGSTASDYTVYANGDYVYHSYAEDGSVLEEEFLMDGQFHSGRRQDDGSVHSYDTYADGGRGETIFTSDGTPVYSAQHDSSGDSLITYYDDNGNIQFQEEMLAGAYLHSTFDENGTLIRLERKEADGSRMETTFDSSGNPIAWREYDASGALIDAYGEEEPAS